MALGFFRRHRRWLYGFLWVVILGFIVFYIPAFTGFREGTPAETLGHVGELTITAGEFQRVYRERRSFYERLYQGRMDPAALRNLGLEEQAFEALVTQRLVLLEARRLGIHVDDAAVARSIVAEPSFQRDGRFVGAAEIRHMLEARGISEDDFKETLRAQLLRDRLEALVAGGVEVTAAEAEQESRRRSEQVKVEYVHVEAARFPATASEEEVKARFERERESYRIPERRVLDYLALDVDALRGRQSVSEREVAAHYQEHRDDFKEEAQACASHIQVKVKGEQEPGGHSDVEARQIAEGLLQKVQGGADFAELAKKSSEDAGTASRGGDLGCFTRDRMLPEIADAAFELQPGETSNRLVKTTHGYHIVRVASRREESVKALEQVKEQVRQTLVDQKLRDFVIAAVTQIAADLRAGRSLEEAGQRHGLTVQKRAPLARDDRGPVATPFSLARAFEMKKGETEPEPFQTQRGYAFIRLAEVQPARLPELKEAQDRVRADVVREKGLAKAAEVAAELRARAEREGLDKAALALGLARKQTPSLVSRGQPLGDLGSSLALDEAAYTLPEKTVSLPLRTSQGFAVLRVVEKKPFDPVEFEKQKPSLLASLRKTRRAKLFEAYLRDARQRFKVERNSEAFKRLVG